jgi:hypothetical protein
LSERAQRFVKERESAHLHKNLFLIRFSKVLAYNTTQVRQQDCPITTVIMPLNSLRKSRDEFKRAIAMEEGIDIKAAAYLRALRRYRTYACSSLMGKTRNTAGLGQRAVSVQGGALRAGVRGFARDAR